MYDRALRVIKDITDYRCTKAHKDAKEPPLTLEIVKVIPDPVGPRRKLYL